ncbi:transmembrane protein, putative [Medicago truncatula]|uniref:Transmembrane protein, putative n=1 Tax=Medicago truncatula TaxID=3880 RepID=G7L8M6_MEDTR|nr:transmembrane protein, putative [Medicago truncatula]
MSYASVSPSKLFFSQSIVSAFSHSLPHHLLCFCLITCFSSLFLLSAFSPSPPSLFLSSRHSDGGDNGGDGEMRW